MKYILFGLDSSKPKVAILIKERALNKIKIERFYITPQPTLSADHFMAFGLKYNDSGKCPAVLAKKCIAELLPEIDELGINTLMVCDAAYFKFLTKNQKADPHYGYVCRCAWEGFEHLQIVLCANYQAMAYNPDLQGKIDWAIQTIDKCLKGTYQPPGVDIIESAEYPDTVEDIKKALDKLLVYPELTCDIETRGLEFWNCGISTIAFAWDLHNGIAFPIDRHGDSIKIRYLLHKFLTNYTGKLVFHNIGYDGKVLVYNLWMNHLADYENMIKGIKIITKNFDDAKLIAYLATNNAVKNALKLKSLSAEFTGNYAQENIKNTDAILLSDLLEYNLKDCLATFYVKRKYEPVMIADQQQDLYEGLFKDSVRTLMQTELCGLPINPEKVQKAKKQLSEIVDNCHKFFEESELIKAFHANELIQLAKEKTAKAKQKVYTVKDEIIARHKFNPNSDTQLRKLLYDYLEYPVIDLTKTKIPSCSGKTLEKLKMRATDPEHIEMFNQLKKLSDASIILSTFIPAFENAQQLPDGSWRLYGNFNLGGTQSLRLSSSKPNLQNIPSGSTFSKIIKDCFQPKFGWLYIGSDFDSLEDKISSLVTKDPNKLKVYTDGYDGHCLRAYSYWSENMPDIDPASVSSINSIKSLYPTERQNSKAPTFALTVSAITQ